MSLTAQRGNQQGLDGVNAVFRLLELDSSKGLEHLIGDFHGIQAELLHDLPAHFGFKVMERG